MDHKALYPDRNTAFWRLLSGFSTMFKALFGRKVSTNHAHALYGAVVARARDPKFYSDYGVPDTFDGRFEMLVTHLFLIHHRLKDEDANAREISQLVFDAFINDMDSALREAAVGDQTVPKRIAKMTQVFYGRTGAFEQALAEKNPIPALSSVIDRNLFPDGSAGKMAEKLAHYTFWQFRDLEAKTTTTITQNAEAFIGPLLDAELYHVDR